MIADENLSDKKQWAVATAAFLMLMKMVPARRRRLIKEISGEDDMKGDFSALIQWARGERPDYMIDDDLELPAPIVLSNKKPPKHSRPRQREAATDDSPESDLH